MARYLLSIYQPDGPPPDSVDLDAIMAELGTLDRDLRAAGAWVFSGGLYPPSTATVVRASAADRAAELLITDGPFAEGKEHLGGFIVVEAADLDGALGWSGRLARITGLPIEVRPFQDNR